MLKHFVIFMLVFAAMHSGAQDIDQINRKLDSLEISKKALRIKIKTLQRMLHETKLDIAELNQLKIKLGSEKVEDSDLVKAYIGESGGVLRDKPMSTGNEIKKLDPGEELLVYKWQQNLYFKVGYKGGYGFVNYSSIEQNNKLDNFLLAEKNKVEESDDFIQLKLDRLTSLYGAKAAEKILNKKLFKGMTPAMVRECLGYPMEIAKEESDREIWRYRDKEVVFEKKVVTAW